jgi:hypothetical protein
MKEISSLGHKQWLIFHVQDNTTLLINRAYLSRYKTCFHRHFKQSDQIFTNRKFAAGRPFAPTFRILYRAPLSGGGRSSSSIL